jgi:hypothetical protein
VISAYPIGLFHSDIAEVRTEEGRLCLFVAVDRTSQFAFGHMRENTNGRIAVDVLHARVAAVPCRIQACSRATARGSSIAPVRTRRP